MAKPSFDADKAADAITRTVQTNIPGWLPDLGTPLALTYGFRAFAPDGNPFYDNYPNADIKAFQRFNADQISAAQNALSLWSDVANVSFTLVATVDGTYANSEDVNLTFANWTAGPAVAFAGGWGAWRYFSPGVTRKSAVWIDSTEPALKNPDLFDYSFALYLHEIGHSIALDHPGKYNAGPNTKISYALNAEYIEDSRQYTVMSYFAETNTGGNFAGLSPMTPMIHDIAAAQLLYGANMTTRTGDTVYGFNSNTVIESYSMTKATDQRVFAIWDAGGEDTIDLSLYSAASIINLAPGSFSSANGLKNNISIAYGALIENAIGGAGGDTITGNDADNVLTGNAGSDTLIGGAGNDTLIGGERSDNLQGGSGDDVIVLQADDALPLDKIDAGETGETTGDVLLVLGSTDVVLSYFDAAKAGIEIWSGNGHGVQGSNWGDSLDFTALVSVSGLAYIDGALGDDRIWGTKFADDLRGNSGDDWLYGGPGEDKLDGGKGRDELDGGADNDTLTGGAGDDRFVYKADGGGDVIFDFTAGAGNIDELDLTAVGITSFVQAMALASSSGLNDENTTFDFSDGNTLTLVDVSLGDLIASDFWVGDVPGENQEPSDIEIGSGLFPDPWVRENWIGATVGGIAVTDPDGDTSFSFSVSDDRFEIAKNGTDAYFSLRLKTGVWLNFEAEPYVELDITATDPGGLSGTFNVVIEVGDHWGFDFTATSASDLIDGTHGIAGKGYTTDDSDYVHGGAGNDVIYGLGGDEHLWGEAGNDTLFGGDGNDQLEGGAGNDTLEGGAGSDDLWGGTGNDILRGGDGDDYISFASANFAHCTFDGGDGFDTLGALGFVTLTLAAFDAASIHVETLTSTGGGALTIRGTAAANVLDFSALTGGLWLYNDSYVDGGAGNDIITGTEDVGRDNRNDLRGNAGNDTLNGLSGHDFLDGGAGHDILNGDDGNDQLKGGAGNDIVDGGNGADIIVAVGAEAQFDILRGGADADRLDAGGAGNLTLSGFDATAQSIESWSGNNRAVLGNAKANTFDLSGLTSIYGISYLDGAGGNDTIVGSTFGDTLRGGIGNDTIEGGAGTDTLYGDAGGDTFVFRSNFGRDTIVGFAATGAAHDFVQFDKSVFADFSAVVAASAQVGTAVVITLDGSNDITLQSMTLAKLTAADFLFI